MWRIICPANSKFKSCKSPYGIWDARVTWLYAVVVVASTAVCPLQVVSVPPCCSVQVLLARVAHKLGPAVSPTAATAAASVLSAASASVSAPLPPLAENTRLDIAAAAFKSPKWKKLVKGGLRAIVANSSRCVSEKFALSSQLQSFLHPAGIAVCTEENACHSCMRSTRAAAQSCVLQGMCAPRNVMQLPFILSIFFV